MLNTITNLGKLINSVENNCGGTKIDITEAAFIAKMIGSVENAICYFENDAELFVSSDLNGTFENMRRVFNFYAEKIIHMEFCNTNEIKGSDYYEFKKEKLVQRMLFYFHGDESTITHIVNTCISLDDIKIDYKDKIYVSYFAGNYCDKRFIVMAIE